MGQPMAGAGSSFENCLIRKGREGSIPSPSAKEAWQSGNAPVLKTGDGVTPAEVRSLSLPPIQNAG
jgi:hypothetical protein